MNLLHNGQYKGNKKSMIFPNFSYSSDGKKYRTLGNPFQAREGKWIGAKIGLFCSRPVSNNDGGRVEADWFEVGR
jgi:hypothetical protein